jgi:integrase
VRISLGYGIDARGKRKRNRFSVYRKTRKEAQAERTKLLHQFNTNTLSAPNKQNVAAFLNHWLETRDDISDRTRDNYQRSIKQQINPVIGAKKLSKLTPLEVQSLYVQMRKCGAGRDTVKLAHNVLHAALEYAVRMNMVTVNVADRVEIPQIQRKEVVPATLGQIKAFLAAAAGDRLEALYVLAIGTGMRLGELFGLQWGDVDLEKGAVNVRHSLQELNGMLTLKPPKSKAGRRTIELPAAVVDALTKHREAAKGDSSVSIPINVDDTAYVFCNLHGGPLRRSHFHRQDFKPLLERAGLPPDMHFHHLRHSHASLLIAQGENPKLVSARLGHSKIGITMDLYSHLMPGVDRAAADKMNALLTTSAVGVKNA